MAKKFYAVRKGIQPGVYETWEDCSKQVNGFSGAVYKSFAARDEAEAFVKGGAAQPKPQEDGAVAYVDGSYDVNAQAYSYGMVFFYEGQELHFSKAYTDPALAQMRNVAGEIMGAQAAMEYCLEHGISSVTICHDYEGIARWCTGEWKAKQPGTAAYAAFYQKAAERVAIRFQKVKGHSGDTYNDLADRLAKQALGILE